MINCRGQTILNTYRRLKDAQQATFCTIILFYCCTTRFAFLLVIVLAVFGLNATVIILVNNNNNNNNNTVVYSQEASERPHISSISVGTSQASALILDPSPVQ